MKYGCYLMLFFFFFKPLHFFQLCWRLCIVAVLKSLYCRPPAKILRYSNKSFSFSTCLLTWTSFNFDIYLHYFTVSSGRKIVFDVWLILIAVCLFFTAQFFSRSQSWKFFTLKNKLILISQGFEIMILKLIH